MSAKREYTKPSVSASGCSYATLVGYNSNYNGRGIAPSSLSAQSAASNEKIVIPSYGGPGYDVFLSQKVPTCSGYNSVQSAYPNYPNCRYKQ